MPDYIEISCKNYIVHLLKLHEWDTKLLSEAIPEEAIASKTVTPDESSQLEEVSCVKTEIHKKNYVPKIWSLKTNLVDPPITPMTKISESNSKINIGAHIFDNKESNFDLMTSSQPLSPLPTKSIGQMYKEEGLFEGSAAHYILEKTKGFSYCPLWWELMYSYIQFLLPSKAKHPFFLQQIKIIHAS